MACGCGNERVWSALGNRGFDRNGPNLAEQRPRFPHKACQTKTKRKFGGRALACPSLLSLLLLAREARVDLAPQFKFWAIVISNFRNLIEISGQIGQDMTYFSLIYAEVTSTAFEKQSLMLLTKSPVAVRLTLSIVTVKRFPRPPTILSKPSESEPDLLFWQSTRPAH